jgi:hypothetical protein
MTLSLQFREQLFLLLLFAGDGQSKGHDQPAVSRHVQVGCPGLDFFRQKFFRIGYRGASEKYKNLSRLLFMRKTFHFCPNFLEIYLVT